MADLILNRRIPSLINIGIEGFPVHHLVRFEWAQGWPYNYYAKYCNCKDCSQWDMKNHMPAGCVPIAMAQVIATMELFKGTFYGNRDIDFRAFPTYVHPLDKLGSDMELSIAHFLQEIALNCQVKYTCTGTYTDLYAATNYLRDLGYLADIIEGPLDVNRFLGYLKRGFPHIMGGRNKSAGHAWILDGALVSLQGLLYHINWGQGHLSSNGWSNACYYGDTSTQYGPDFTNYHKDHQHVYIVVPQN